MLWCAPLHNPKGKCWTFWLNDKAWIRHMIIPKTITLLKRKLIRTFRKVFILIRIGNLSRFQFSCIGHLILLLSKLLLIIWLFNRLTFNVPYAGYWRHASGSLYYISLFWLRTCFIRSPRNHDQGYLCANYGSKAIYSSVIWDAMWFFVFDIGGIVDHHGCTFLFIITISSAA